jgi:pilus assembly protein CpaB
MMGSSRRSRGNRVRGSTFIMIGIAAVVGLLAVFIANSWLNRQAAERLRNLEANRPTVVGDTVVVAAKPLRFGSEINASVVREVAWPEAAAPAGSFKKIDQLLTGGRRVVLTAIEPNEPILASKVTGPGQRATLSSMLDPGMKGVTVRVNDVDGVAGFVLPGDRVDVVVTQQQEKNVAFSEVVLQNIRVLAIDQVADDRTDKPSVVKAVTLEVDLTSAEKLTLAARVGSLSLALRRAGESEPTSVRAVSLSDLAMIEQKTVPDSGQYSSIAVTRGSTRTVYSVPREYRGARETADAGQE